MSRPRAPRVMLVALALALSAGCRGPRCEDLAAEPIPGSYRGGGSLHGERILDVSMQASAKEVIVTYTALDGSRIRAKYRVAKKTKPR